MGLGILRIEFHPTLQIRLGFRVALQISQCHGARSGSTRVVGADRWAGDPSQHFLYFRPLPQGQRSFRPGFEVNFRSSRVVGAHRKYSRPSYRFWDMDKKEAAAGSDEPATA